MLLFLDIDGVLNTSSDWKMNGVIREENVRNLAEAFKNIAIRIMLISSWRHGFITRKNPGNSTQIKNLEEKLDKYGMYISGIVACKEQNRRKAIEDYLMAHPYPYIILDDDKSEYDRILPHTYFINPDTGITKKDAVKIRKEM